MVYWQNNAHVHYYGMIVNKCDLHDERLMKHVRVKHEKTL